MQGAVRLLRRLGPDAGKKKGPGRSTWALARTGSAGRTRTYDPAVNSRLLYRLSYRGSGADPVGVLEARTGIEPMYKALQASA